MNMNMMNETMDNEQLAALDTEATEIIEQTRAKVLPREKRIHAIEALLNKYVNCTGNRPPNKMLNRLSNAILAGELTDSNRMKTRNSEYPILSELQLARRRGGKHQRKDRTRGESPLSHASEMGTDGHNYRYPSRKIRSVYELLLIDQQAKIHDYERDKQYREYISTGMVLKYSLNERALTPSFVGVSQS